MVVHFTLACVDLSKSYLNDMHLLFIKSDYIETAFTFIDKLFLNRKNIIFMEKNNNVDAMNIIRESEVASYRIRDSESKRLRIFKRYFEAGRSGNLSERELRFLLN